VVRADNERFDDVAPCLERTTTNDDPFGDSFRTRVVRYCRQDRRPNVTVRVPLRYYTLPRPDGEKNGRRFFPPKIYRIFRFKNPLSVQSTRFGIYWRITNFVISELIRENRGKLYALTIENQLYR